MAMRATLPLIALLGAGLLAGCATGPDLKARNAALVGQTESALIRKLGMPDRRITVGDTTFFAYARTEYGRVPGSIGGPLFIDQRPVPYGFTPTVAPKLLVNSCTTTFVIEGGLVKSFTMRGNDC